MQLPSRLSWDGTLRDSTFDDLKQAQSHLNGGFLTNMLEAVGELQKSASIHES